MYKTVLEHPDHHIGIEGGLRFNVMGNAVDVQEGVAGAVKNVGRGALFGWHGLVIGVYAPKS
jgi:hypothetical protein